MQQTSNLKPVDPAYIDEASLLQKIRENAQARKIQVISDETARFLEAVCFIKKPEKILEIGCGTGYSTYFILKSLRRIIEPRDIRQKNYSVTDDKKYFYTGIDLNRERIAEAKNYIEKTFPEFGTDNQIRDLINIRFLLGNAIKIIPQLGQRFDFVFMDAAKFEYPLYIKSLEGKLEEGAIVIADNVFYSGKIFNNNITGHDRNSVAGLKEFIKYISETDNIRTDFFNISDGISVSIFKG